MLDIELLFKIGAAGILLAVIDKILKSSGKEDVAAVINMGGIVIILLMVINLISKLFMSVKTMFHL